MTSVRELCYIAVAEKHTKKHIIPTEMQAVTTFVAVTIGNISMLLGMYGNPTYDTMSSHASGLHSRTMRTAGPTIQVNTVQIVARMGELWQSLCDTCDWAVPWSDVLLPQAMS